MQVIIPSARPPAVGPDFFRRGRPKDPSLRPLQHAEFDLLFVALAGDIEDLASQRPHPVAGLAVGDPFEVHSDSPRWRQLRAAASITDTRILLSSPATRYY